MQRQYQALPLVGFLIVAAFICPVFAQDSQASMRIALAGGEGNVSVALTDGIGTITARGEIGGEAQDFYALKLEAGRTVTILLYSEQSKAEFSIDNGKNEGHPGFSAITKSVRVKYFTKSKKVKYRKAVKWSGIVPQTDDYTITVSAYPGSASYTLQIKIK